jgi:hypothetical protein
VNVRKTAARGLLAIVYLGIGVLAFLSGRGHHLFIDNPVGGGAVTVSIEGGKPLTIRDGGMRVMQVKGQEEDIHFAFADGRPAFDVKVSIPLVADTVGLQVAGLQAGAQVKAMALPDSTEEH